MAHFPDYYKILGVHREVNLKELENKFLEKTQELEQLHSKEPWFPYQESILELSKAFFTLSNPDLREQYDQKIDFDVVVLDSNIDKTDLAKISYEYKKYYIKNFDLMTRRFEYFKKELNKSLWMIKVTSIFFIVSAILSAIVTYYYYFSWKPQTESTFLEFKNFGFLFFISILLIQFIGFYYIWMKPKLENFKKNI